MFSANNRPWSPWHSAYCCLSLSFNIVCRCLSTRTATSHPAFGNPPLCPHLLLLPAPDSGVGPDSPRGKCRDVTFSCQSSPQVWDWHTSQARSSVEDISLGWGRPSATHRHEAIIFCLGDMLNKPQPCTIIPAAFAYVMHFYMVCSQWVACGEPSHMYQTLPSSALVLHGRGAGLHSTAFETSVCWASDYSHHMKGLQMPPAFSLTSAHVGLS